LMPTLETVFNRLEQPLPLGYCNVGMVKEVGEGVSDFRTGDRVVSNGPHAEYVCVPQNLVAPIPVNITDDQAVFTVLGSIGLQGIRLCNPSLGEIIVVMGLGLIGLITAQLLKINGCKVIGIDPDPSKIILAKSLGINCFNPEDGLDPVQHINNVTNQTGADGVIITASTKSNDVVSQAARMSRKRGRIILVGVVGLNLSRAEFYEKELIFQVSCSYGPGRYDTNYEEHGIDYPVPYVRWTENRNFNAVLAMLKSGGLKVEPLISELVELHDFQMIYGDLKRPHIIASILKYPGSKIDENRIITINQTSKKFNSNKAVVGIIGSGNFVKMTMLPALSKVDCQLKYIASKDGLNSTVLAKKYAISHSTSDYKTILDDPEINLVMVVTRHHQHASLILESLNSGKNIFVEKPLCLTVQELDDITNCYRKVSSNEHAPILTIGFNRRYAPHVKKVKELIGVPEQPINLVITVNAGYIPENSWVHDTLVGGGRIIGEAVHFIDLASFICSASIAAVCMNGMGLAPKTDLDNASILLKFDNGSNAVINYFSNGNKGYSKERIEIYVSGKTLVIDNFRSVVAYGFKNFRKFKTRIDKGHKTQFNTLINAVNESGPALIPFDQILNTTRASFAALKSLMKHSWVDI